METLTHRPDRKAVRVSSEGLSIAQPPPATPRESYPILSFQRIIGIIIILTSRPEAHFAGVPFKNPLIFATDVG